MKIKHGFVLRKIGNAYYAVPIAPNEKIGNGMVKLNETAYFIWKKLEDECTEEELTESLCKEYSVSYDEALADIKTYEELLRKADILEGNA